MTWRESIFVSLTWWEQGCFNQTQVWVSICHAASWGWTATVINFRGLTTESSWVCLFFLEGIFHCHCQRMVSSTATREHFLQTHLKRKGEKNNTTRSIGHRLYHSTISFFYMYSDLVDARISALLLQSLLTLMRLQLLCAVLFQSHVLITLQICLWRPLIVFAQY